MASNSSSDKDAMLALYGSVIDSPTVESQVCWHDVSLDALMNKADVKTTAPERPHA